MEKKLIFWCFTILFAFDACSAEKHTFGVEYLGFDTIFSKKVIDRVSDVPKNYTIIFKYMGGKVSPMLSYFEVDVNVFSEGRIQVTNEMKNVDATITIPNARNVTATMSLCGVDGGGLAIRRWPFKKDDYSTKSYTFVYVKNATVTPSARATASNSIGTRQSGDELIHFESRNVTNASRFPSRVFEYSGDESITYVGFSFNSPTAMALVNTTFITGKEFTAVAYDMNTDHFMANMSIYGYKYPPLESYVSLFGG